MKKLLLGTILAATLVAGFGVTHHTTQAQEKPAVTVGNGIAQAGKALYGKTAEPPADPKAAALAVGTAAVQGGAKWVASHE